MQRFQLFLQETRSWSFCRGLVAQLVERPSKVPSLGATLSTDGREFESQPRHKVVENFLAAPSVKHWNKRVVEANNLPLTLLTPVPKVQGIYCKPFLASETQLKRNTVHWKPLLEFCCVEKLQSIHLIRNPVLIIRVSWSLNHPIYRLVKVLDIVVSNWCNCCWIVCHFFQYIFLNSSLYLQQMALLGFFLPPYAVTWSERERDDFGRDSNPRQ